jgi:multidrug efflux pump subunit AcrB
MAFIGMVVTAGIIINDSIIKIDTINRLRRSGQYSIREAIHEGGKKRVNPIIMTSLTSILAVIPFLWGQDLGASLQKTFSPALIGGMTVGTMVSLWLIPLLYALIYKKY